MSGCIIPLTSTDNGVSYAQDMELGLEEIQRHETWFKTSSSLQFSEKVRQGKSLIIQTKIHWFSLMCPETGPTSESRCIKFLASKNGSKT